MKIFQFWMTHSPLPFFEAVTQALTLNIRSQITVCWFTVIACLIAANSRFLTKSLIFWTVLCANAGPSTCLQWLHFSFAHRVFETLRYSRHLNPGPHFLLALLDPWIFFQGLEEEYFPAFPGKYAASTIKIFDYIRE